MKLMLSILLIARARLALVDSL